MGAIALGDLDRDGALDVALVRGMRTGSVDCLDAANANDDGGVNIADAIHTLGFVPLRGDGARAAGARRGRSSPKG